MNRPVFRIAYKAHVCRTWALFIPSRAEKQVDRLLHVLSWLASTPLTSPRGIIMQPAPCMGRLLDEWIDATLLLMHQETQS